MQGNVRAESYRIIRFAARCCAAAVVAALLMSGQTGWADDPQPAAPPADKPDGIKSPSAPDGRGRSEDPKGDRRSGADSSGKRDRFHGHHGPPPGMSWMSDMPERDPELAKLFEKDGELERQTHRAGDKFRQAKTDEDRAKAKTELQAIVAEHFEVRQQRREMELKRLEEQLDRLRASLKKRAEQEKEIIEQRVGELTAPRGLSGF